MSTKECINTIYEERNKFILIGLTGRTGSGCTEVANILSTDSFDELSLKEPKNQDFKNNDERKYRVIYNYAKHNWNKFFVINMSEVIFSFILQYKFDDLIKVLERFFKDNKGIMQNLANKRNFIKDYDNAHKKLEKLLTKENELTRENKEYLVAEYKLLVDIKELQKEFKNFLTQYQYKTKVDDEAKDFNAYTYLYQKIGTNIRTSGNIEGKNFNSKSMFHLARRANDFIKAIRKNTGNNKPTLICIDAIRNPYEAYYFKDRYAAFYLVSVNTEEVERKNRLSSQTEEQIKSLDKVEYPDDLKDIKLFTNQNIAACLENSDIHIYNPHSSTEEKFYLTEQIVKYVMLMKHPGLVTPTHIERCMQVAYNAKLNSGCLSRQVGAVITDPDYSIKAVGWNNVPEGQVPCNLRDIHDLYVNKDEQAFSDYEIENDKFNEIIASEFKKLEACNLGGRCYQYCFKDVYEDVTGKKNQVHTRALHAEENAFLQIVKYGGQGIKGGKLFVTASPCELCSKKAYQLGIKEIYYIDPYPGISMKHILAFTSYNDCKPTTQLFHGAIGKAYTCLYSQRMSIKDELSLLTKKD